MGFLLDLFKGILMGIANIIPGVSGGTMAVSLGIYDKFIGGLSGFTKDWKKSIKMLLPIVLGMGIGIIGFTYIIPLLLEKFTFATCLTFVGLIFGGLPILFKEFKEKLAETNSKVGIKNGIAFLILFAIAVGLPMIGTGAETTEAIAPSVIGVFVLFIVGVVAAGTMVIPGVSGSMVLMILGYYYGIINSIKAFLSAVFALDMAGILDGIFVLAPFGIGVLVGIVGIAKIIEYMFNKHSVMTYSAIFGLIIASPFAIFYNTGLYKELSSVSIGAVIIGLVLAAVGGYGTYLLGKKTA